MADASDILEVRRNTAETEAESTYTDEVIGGYVDDLGVAGASAKVWEEKAAEYAELVNVSEAGSSHSFSDLHKHAVTSASYWSAKYTAESTVVVSQRPKVKKIVRS